MKNFKEKNLVSDIGAWKVDGEKVSADMEKNLSEIFPKNVAKFVLVQIKIKLFVNDIQKEITDLNAPLEVYLPPNAISASSIVAIMDNDPTIISPTDLPQYTLQTFLEMEPNLLILKINITFPPQGGLFVLLATTNHKIKVELDALLSSVFSTKISLAIQDKNDDPLETVDLDETFWSMLTMLSDMGEEELKKYLETNEITIIAT